MTVHEHVLTDIDEEEEFDYQESKYDGKSEHNI